VKFFKPRNFTALVVFEIEMIEIIEIHHQFALISIVRHCRDTGKRRCIFTYSEGEHRRNQPWEITKERKREATPPLSSLSETQSFFFLHGLFSYVVLRLSRCAT